MASTLKYIAVDLWHEIGDPRAEDYFWLGGPWLTWLATVTYLYIVLKAGPEFMRDRKPYNLKLSIRLYNLILVIINAYLFWGTLNALRYLEFFDTFFFLLRKKNSQVSFLHVFHHGVVPTLMYIGLKFYPVPFNGLLPITNMFVHIIMYAYYFLATFGPDIQKYLWWKRYLTTMQIGLVVINVCIGLTFLSLFVSFYKRSYCKNNTSPKVDPSSEKGPARNGSSRNCEPVTSQGFEQAPVKKNL